MGAQVLELKEGRAVLQLKECRKLRNHLNSMHAVALMNLAELTSGLAVTSRVPPTHRGIVKAFKIDFEKKARGKLTAKSEYLTPIPQQATDLDVHVEIFNELGERVCKATTLWRIGPILDTVNQG
jgi:acyl-coenzyme A thioesterase PaaI-like protein